MLLDVRYFDVYCIVLEKDIVVVLYRTHNSALGTFALVLFWMKSVFLSFNKSKSPQNCDNLQPRLVLTTARCCQGVNPDQVRKKSKTKLGNFSGSSCCWQAQYFPRGRGTASGECGGDQTFCCNGPKNQVFKDNHKRFTNQCPVLVLNS